MYVQNRFEEEKREIVQEYVMFIRGSRMIMLLLWEGICVLTCYTPRKPGRPRIHPFAAGFFACGGLTDH